MLLAVIGGRAEIVALVLPRAHRKVPVSSIGSDNVRTELANQFSIFFGSETPSRNRKRTRCYTAPAVGYGRRYPVRAARLRFARAASLRSQVCRGHSS